MLINGQWSENWHPVQKSGADGRFIRQRSGFRDRVGSDSAFAPEPGRYVLYLAYICPWASRALIALRLKGLEDEIAKVNAYFYANFNNGVYQAGFAGSQSAYDEAVGKVFAALDWMQQRLAMAPWLVGDQLTETDIRAFVTLVRFELAYSGLFKCNLRPLSAYPAVYDYLPATRPDTGTTPGEKRAA